MDRLQDLLRVSLDHVFLLRQPHAVHDPARLHRSAADAVESLEQRARKAGFSAEHARLLKYALVACIDEAAQAHPGTLANYWEEHLLQRDYFNEVRVGEGFFVHLERLLAAPREQADALDVLEAYAICLFLGFRGKYATGQRGFDALMTRVEERLKDRLKDDKEDETLRRLQPAPWRPPPRTRPLAPWVAGLALFFMIVVMLTYRVELASDANRLAELLAGGSP